MGLSQPLFALDPFAADARAEAARLLAYGPVVLNSGNWGAPQRGEAPAGRPPIKITKARYMGTADGAEHRRLRNLVSGAFTPRPADAQAA
ncbi:hypothetical protein ACH4FX_20045 [Streptomyces sp. NPDC018019]|uniref:hypothetical protein n=1 Tax=Streptomyces sp. NPDC018019 TaxID=3365030 RepID=UPI0037B24652